MMPCEKNVGVGFLFEIVEGFEGVFSLQARPFSAEALQSSISNHPKSCQILKPHFGTSTRLPAPRPRPPGHAGPSNSPPPPPAAASQGPCCRFPPRSAEACCLGGSSEWIPQGVTSFAGDILQNAKEKQKPYCNRIMLSDISLSM